MSIIYALLWSKKQNCFHTEPIEDSAEIGMSGFLEDKDLNDYHLIAFGPRSEVWSKADELREVLKKRGKPWSA